MDFGVLPPEVNSARMYAGPGSESMMAAAAAWDGVAAELSSATAAYPSVVSALIAEPWLGQASAAMAAAAAPYAGWLATTAALAEQTATQARTAAAAFETAFAMTVPPPLIAANRSRLMSLVATNIVGQNSAAIAATEAEYAEMWAQDAAAMYSYEAASAAASTLKPFTHPTRNTDLTAQTAMLTQAGAATNPQTLLAQLSSGAVGGGLPPPFSAADPFTSGLLGIASSLGPQLPNAAQAIPTPIGELDVLALYIAAVGTGSLALSITNTTRPWPGGLYGNGGALQPTQGGTIGATTAEPGPDRESGGEAGLATAGVGHASLVGALSVPHSWTTTAPEIRLAVEALPSSGVGADSTVVDGNATGLLSGMALASLAARGMSGAGSAGSRDTGAAGPAQEERKPTVVVIQKPPPTPNRPL
ncbi:PPE family protein [Mycobacterium sp. HUMS_1102779]|uniref:PPE family protein n=1 Tax=Mycobacterium sp. HUMS_1102779 TaxID=3383487 RepID=UPI00389A1958